MKKVLAATILVMLSSNVFAEGARPKPGLWEMKVTKQIVDGRDMQAQMAAAEAQMEQAMANLTPEQRKQMEAMGARHGSHGGTRICISKEMAARDEPVLRRKAHCETAKFKRSGNKVSFEFNCSNKGHTESGKGVTTISSDLMETVTDINMTDAHGSHTIHNESQMKYIGADCQGIKPADQLSREMQGNGR